jgi:hypothetical protein
VGAEDPDAPLLPPSPGEVGLPTGDDDRSVVDLSEPEVSGETGPFDKDDCAHAAEERVTHTATINAISDFIRTLSFELPVRIACA